jgi:hypothetical protein
VRECEEEEIRDERMVCRPDPLLLPFHFCPRGTKEMKGRPQEQELWAGGRHRQAVLRTIHNRVKMDGPPPRTIHVRGGKENKLTTIHLSETVDRSAIFFHNLLSGRHLLSAAKEKII